MLKRYKNILLLFLVVVSISFFLNGCNENDDSEEVDSSYDLTYEIKDIILEDVKGEVEQVIKRKDILYVLTKEQASFHLYKTNADGSNADEIQIPFKENGGDNYICIDHEDNILCLISEAEKGAGKTLIKINKSGEIVNQIELQDVIQCEKNGIINRMVINNQGNIILASADAIYSLDENLKLVNRVNIKDEFEMVTFCNTKSGEIVCGMIKETKDGNSEESGVLKLLDIEKGEWNDNLPMPNDLWIDDKCIIEGQEYDFYYKDGFGIYGYDSVENSWTTVLDSRYSLLTTQDIEYISVEENGQFYGTLPDISDSLDMCVIEMYTKGENRKEEDKKIIKFATYNVQDPLRTVVREFNKTHNDCKIEIILYDDEDHTKLGQDIALGKIPDIFNPSELGMPMEQLIKKGIIEDLTPYYEKDDYICINDIHPSVWEGMRIDGKIYFTAPYFSLWSAASLKDTVGNRTGWNLSEMKSILNEKGNDASAFDFSEKEMILDCILLGNLNDYINWQTGDCYFDSKEFKDILEFCNEGTLDEQMNEEEYHELMEIIENKMKDGKILMSVDQNVSLNSIQQTRQRFGSDITYIGLPQSDRQGNYFVFDEKYSIFSKSKMKNEAWEFIRMVMSEDYQTNVKLLKYSIFPTRKDCLEWNLETKMAKEAYEDQYGNWIEPVETEIWDDGYGTKYKTGPASTEDVDIFLDLLNHTYKQTSWDDKAGEIIYEEAMEYFYGKKSLDKTAKIIQKRVKTYVNEKR